MITIRVDVTGEGPQDKVFNLLRRSLEENMSTTPWKLVVKTEDGGVGRRINEGLVLR